MKISREDWDRVAKKAHEVTEATETSDDPMYEVHRESMLTLLDELEAKYGPQSQILATRAGYLDDLAEKRRLFHEALDLAKRCHDADEVSEKLDSISHLEDEADT